MAIKDIFTMIKADRYTSDGREELIKAQEAVTEDVTYKPGDISRKTGLQKQPDGSWAPVKNAPAQKKNVHGDEVDKIYEQHINRIKELRKKGYSDEQIEKDKVYQQTKEAMRNVGKESTSGSGLSERAQYSVSQTAAGMSTEALKSHVDKLKNDPATRNAVSNPDAMAKAYESELAKRGETVTKMSDLVAQKSRPESAPSGRQPTPEMLEREKMRQSPEAKARRDKLDAEHPRTETGAPKDVKSMSISELKEQRDKLKSGSGPENDAQYKKVNDELTRKRLQTLSVGSEVKAHGTPLKITSINTDTNTIRGEFDHNGEKVSTTIGLEDIDDYDNITESGGSAPSELKIQGMSKEEYIPWRMKTYKENEAQASSVWNHFAEQQKNKGKENEYDPDFHPLRDSAPRILTGDCKVRIKKSK